MKDVLLLVGTGQIGMAIARRIGFDKKIIIGDKNLDNAKKGVNTMRIAVTYDNGNIFQHFGHTSQFKVYDIENNQIINEQIIDTQGQGHGALATFLNNAQADILICGGIGGGAQNALAQAGIKLFGGVMGNL